MTGTLGPFGLLDLFQLLAASPRTGRLLIDHPGGVARVYLDKGRVVHADFAGLEGEEAIFALFRDERGGFEFTPGPAAPETSIEKSPENLLLAAIRPVEASRRTGPEIADDAVPACAEGSPAAKQLTLETREAAVLRLIDGRRDVAKIAADAKTPLEEVKAVVARLVRIGALTVHSKKPRLARLVTQLSQEALPPEGLGIDPTLLDSWERVLGRLPEQIACRRPSGRVDVFRVVPVRGAGPYLLLSRDTLFAADLAVDTTLLVKPL